MSEDSKMLLCYNRGCGETFESSKNSNDSCTYHPGVPVFHDAYKKWSCCEKKTTDFTEFLNMKGCTKAYHSNVKPPEVVKSKEEKENSNNEVYSYVPPQPLKPKVAYKRPDANLPMVKLKFSIGSSLKPLLEKMQTSLCIEKDDDAIKTIAVDTPCKNGGCKVLYKGEHSTNETCIYHCGVPVFHEGLKFWTCCLKKTTDFDSFLEQVGCATGNHLWYKPKHHEKKSICRYDWHQTGSSVVISIYAKCSFPDLSSIDGNPVKLKWHIVFGEEKNVYETEFDLFGVVDIENSCVSYLGSKIEIKLKKAEPSSWKDLVTLNKTPDKSNEQSADDVNISDIQSA